MSVRDLTSSLNSSDETPSTITPWTALPNPFTHRKDRTTPTNPTNHPKAQQHISEAAQLRKMVETVSPCGSQTKRQADCPLPGQNQGLPYRKASAEKLDVSRSLPHSHGPLNPDFQPLTTHQTLPALSGNPYRNDSPPTGG